MAGGSGLDRAKSEIVRLLASELKATPDLVQVDMRDSRLESISYNQDSASYPGLSTVYRKTLFSAVVNKDAEALLLQRLGLPDDSPFDIVDDQNQNTVSMKWCTPEELEKESIVVSFSKRELKEFEGLKQLEEEKWTEDMMTKVLQNHHVDMSKFGQGSARSIKQFVDETNTGETKLWSDGGSKLRRHLDILVVKIKNPFGAYLIETGHSFGKGQSKQKNAFPATKIRPFEDKVWAVRRLLGEVDIPYSSSKIMFGPTRVDRNESPSYPGIMTVYVKQIVEVQLMEIDVNNLSGDDMGRDKWYKNQNESEKIDLKVGTPRQFGRLTTDEQD
jgi:hypothetical protein